MQYLARAFWITVVAAAFASTARSQPGPSFDHLQCFEITDPMPRDVATGDLVPEHGTPFQTASGCRVRFPAKYFCTDVRKENVQPSPPASIGGAGLGEYFCYRLACPRATAPERGSTVAAADQFGGRVIKLAKRSPLLCVPATRGVPPTTTPAATPTVTGAGTPTATPTPDFGCFFDGGECQGACTTSTSGRCLWDPAQGRCICPAAFDMDCNQFNVVAQCGHGSLLCPAPGQVCVLTEGPSCLCVAQPPP